MANRQITNPEQLTAMSRTAQRCAELIEVTLGNDVIRLTNASFNVAYGGNNYLPLGDFLGFSDVEETSDMAIASVTITISGIEPLTLSQWLVDDYIDKPVRIYRVYFSDDWDLIGDPLMLFDGRIDSPMVQDTGNTVTVGCKVNSTWATFNRRNGRFTSDDLQRAIFPNDKGFEYSAVDKPNLKWGG